MGYLRIDQKMFCMFFIANPKENLGRPKEKFVSVSLLHVSAYVKKMRQNILFYLFRKLSHFITSFD